MSLLLPRRSNIIKDICATGISILCFTLIISVYHEVINDDDVIEDVCCLLRQF